MREVFDVQCGRAPRRALLAAACGGGLLTPSADRLQQLVRPDSIYDVYLVEDVPFARGQFASVRKCTHKLTGQRFAAKVLRKRRRLTDIYHEIAVLDTFADCNRIVQLHEVYETNTEIILVLELATGGEMQTLLDVEDFIREDQVIRLMRQILEGLHQLHDNNIAHLDIKPQNLLLTGPFPSCDVKLCDFGISRQVYGAGELREIMGTADYMAPEILNYEPLSLATDMWSIGVLTYALLTGYSPFTGSTVQETYCNITSEEVDFPDDLFIDISDTAKNFISGLLVKNPSGRRTIHSCLEHPWLSSPAAPSAPLTVPDLRADDKDSGFSSPVSSDDETSLPFTVPTPTPQPACLIDNGNLEPVRVGRTGAITGAYTIENALPTEPRPPVDNEPPSPSTEVGVRQLTPAEVALRPLTPPEVTQVTLHALAPPEVTLHPLNATEVTLHALTPSPAEDEVSDVTSEASSDRTSDMSWEETEFSYRRLSVAQLTDRVWDCFNEHDFNVEPVRPWENVCTGAVGRAKALFMGKAVAPAPAARAPAAASTRASPRRH
ncbi:serine/threonine-protein kinase 17B-like [Pollicipes pollicipes]|uniref:serine/threonine-protein kinase 17B-like n=1 Tax=Pollicipes pollicipes TaxID=41117 RepID=UPI0018856969|nr:serine/threonine-protein kinase 17B-like [Pollicipes pollicipes]